MVCGCRDRDAIRETETCSHTATGDKEKLRNRHRHTSDMVWSIAVVTASFVIDVDALRAEERFV